MNDKAFSPEVRLRVMHLMSKMRAKDVATHLKLSLGTLMAIYNDGHNYCRSCGNPLPCRKCAQEARKRSGNIGKEPPYEEHPCALDPEVAKLTEAIRACWTRKEEQDRLNQCYRR